MEDFGVDMISLAILLKNLGIELNIILLNRGTPSENTQQCIRDGRGYIGDKNPRAKVKNIDREIIRRKFTLGSTINELTKEYNLSRSAIRKILYLSI